MEMSRKLACMVGIALASGAANANAAFGYEPGYDGYDRYGQDDRYGDDRYDDRRYDDRRYDHEDRNRGRQVIRCESRDRRTVYCGVDTRGGVRLVDQMSDRSCVRGRTWGTNSRGLWVTNGCRGKFEINARSNDRYGRVIRCESRDNRTQYCNADIRSGVRLVRQLSNDACVEGRSWGASRDGIWVTRGCRAEFRIGDSRQDNGYGSRY